VVAKYNPENDKKVRDYYLRRKGIPQDKLDKMKEDGVAEGEKPEYQKLLKQIKQNAKNDPNRIPRGYELTDHGMLVKKHKTEKSNDGVGGLGEGMVEGTFQDDGKMDWNAWKQKAKKHGAVKFTDTDNKTIAYDKDGKVVSSITWSQKKSGMAEATGDTSFDSMMGNIVKGARYKGAAADQRADAAYSGMMNNITKNAADVAKPSADSKFEQVYSAVERILLSNNVHWDIDDDISDALKKLKIKASDALMQKLERELINRVSDALQYYDDGDLAESGVAEGSENNPVVNAITRRIMMQRSDLLSKYGPEKVGQAVDEVADFVGNVEEIGSSDVSGWVRHVEQMLGNMEQDVAEEAAAPTFKPGDRVMYAGKFATVVAQDGDAYGIRVDAQPGTMKVLASQIKKPSYDESVAESIDPIEQLRADIRRFAL
jgi:ribosomal protein L21E